MITITGIGDHLRPEWLITITGMRIHGVAGLRVADASIVPTLTSGNTNAPSIIIGEKAADMVLSAAT